MYLKSAVRAHNATIRGTNTRIIYMILLCIQMHVQLQLDTQCHALLYGVTVSVEGVSSVHVLIRCLAIDITQIVYKRNIHDQAP